MNTKYPSHRRRPAAVQNRVLSHMIHIPRYSFRGMSRLARDANVSKSALSRLLHSQGEPEYSVIYKVTEALSRVRGTPLDLREVAVSIGDSYPTPCTCSLYGCRCLPPWAYTKTGTLRPDWIGIKPGTWTSNGQVRDLHN